MTVGHLLFAVVTTGYVLIGIAFEERDLRRALGARYDEYRQNVAMLIPFLGKGDSASAASDPVQASARTSPKL